MPTAKQVARRGRQQMRRLIRDGARKMIVGRLLSDNSVTVAGAPTGKLWVRSHPASREVTAVWTSKIYLPNAQVWVGPSLSGEDEIKGLVYAETAAQLGSKALFAETPPIDGQINVLEVYGQNIVPGRLRAYAESGSMLVYVEAFAHEYGRFEGGTIDMSGHTPMSAGANQWVAVATDPKTNTLYAYDGAEDYNTSVNLTVESAFAIAIPRGYYANGAVVLNAATTEITPANRFLDMRIHFSRYDPEYTLGKLVDVDLDSIPPTNGQGLMYNSGTSKWEPGDFAGGGGSTITGDVLPSTCQGRLTLTTGVPITTSDVTAADTLYFTPFYGNVAALHDGSSTWTGHTFTERALALGALSADTNYDVFLWDDSGTLKLEAVAWTDGTTRATALTTQDGIYVKSGATTHRYLGTIRTTASAGECEDSEAKRLVWNCYNRKRRKLLYKNTSATSWNYNSSTWRAFNNSTAYRVQVVTGLAESFVEMSAFAFVSQNAAAWDSGIARDSTSTAVHDQHGAQYHNSATLIQQSVPLALLRETCPLGYHYYQAIERVRANTATAINDPAGLAGDIEA